MPGESCISCGVLSPGNYLLRDTYAPAGYAMTSDITFTINSDFTVAVTSKSGKLDGQTLTVIDQPLEVKLQGGPQRQLSGRGFHDADG